MSRLRNSAKLALAVLGTLLPPRIASAQPVSSMSAVYTALKTTPTATDFAQNFVVVGRFDVALANCRTNVCRIHIQGTGQPPLMKAKIGGPAPSDFSQCNVTISSVAATTQVLQSGTATTVQVWLCYPLNWTTTPPASLSASQFQFRLTQNNS